METPIPPKRCYLSARIYGALTQRNIGVPYWTVLCHDPKCNTSNQGLNLLAFSGLKLVCPLHSRAFQDSSFNCWMLVHLFWHPGIWHSYQKHDLSIYLSHSRKLKIVFISWVYLLSWLVTTCVSKGDYFPLKSFFFLKPVWQTTQLKWVTCSSTLSLQTFFFFGLAENCPWKSIIWFYCCYILFHSLEWTI